jgi:hypothetical protein
MVSTKLLKLLAVVISESVKEVIMVRVAPSTVVIRGEYATVHEVAVGVDTSEPRSDLFETMLMGVSVITARGVRVLHEARYRG